MSLVTRTLLYWLASAALGYSVAALAQDAALVVGDGAGSARPGLGGDSELARRPDLLRLLRQGV